VRDVENGASNRIADLQGAGETTIPLREAGSGEELSADTAAIERLAGQSSSAVRSIEACRHLPPKDWH
jgi:hypothetical protein